MNHAVYVVMINDRHADPESEVFAGLSDALQFAIDYTCQHGRPEDIRVEAPPEGWLYLAYYTVEDDCVWVLEKTLR